MIDEPELEEEYAIRKGFEGPYGDRKQEITLHFYWYTHLDEKALTEKLNSCLLTNEEYALGPDEWKSFADAQL